jgi:hypothetical protein
MKRILSQIDVTWLAFFAGCFCGACFLFCLIF